MNSGVEKQLEEVLNSMDHNQNTTVDVERNSKELSTKINTVSTLTMERASGRRSLAGIVYCPPIGAPPGHYKRAPPPGVLEPRIVRSNASDFKLSAFKKQSVNAAIELLFEAPRANIRSRTRMGSRVDCDSSGQHTDSGELPLPTTIPERMRIRSPKLLEFFQYIPESVGPGLDMPCPTSVVCFHHRVNDRYIVSKMRF